MHRMNIIALSATWKWKLLLPPLQKPLKCTSQISFPSFSPKCSHSFNFINDFDLFPKFYLNGIAQNVLCVCMCLCVLHIYHSPLYGIIHIAICTWSSFNLLCSLVLCFMNRVWVICSTLENFTLFLFMSISHISAINIFVTFSMSVYTLFSII